LRAFLKENDLFRLSRNNASIFREIHLPLKGKAAFGAVTLSLANQN
jgi:hypothetical protein